MAAPSFRALSRLFRSSARTSSPPCTRSLHTDMCRFLVPGARMVFEPSAGAGAGIPSKVEDEKLPEWSLYEYAWCGPQWWMAFEIAEIKKMYPDIPLEYVHIGMLLQEGQRPKLFSCMSINAYSVMVKADFKGQDVVKRTMLVTGRDDVKELEAAAERINKFRSLFTWNRQ